MKESDSFIGVVVNHHRRITVDRSGLIIHVDDDRARVDLWYDNSDQRLQFFTYFLSQFNRPMMIYFGTDGSISHRFTFHIDTTQNTEQNWFRWDLANDQRATEFRFGQRSRSLLEIQQLASAMVSCLPFSHLSSWPTPHLLIHGGWSRNFQPGEGLTKKGRSLVVAMGCNKNLPRWVRSVGRLIPFLYLSLQNFFSALFFDITVQWD